MSFMKKTAKFNDRTKIVGYNFFDKMYRRAKTQAKNPGL